MSQNIDCPSSLPNNHPPVRFGKTGVLLVNLGTPDGTDYWSMRRYLAEFLSDKRVIEWSRWLWYPILYGIVLSKRPQKSGAATKRSGTTSWMKARYARLPEISPISLVSFWLIWVTNWLLTGRCAMEAHLSKAGWMRLKRRVVIEFWYSRCTRNIPRLRLQP